MKRWSQCKKVLCIRPDNMGDVLMSAPAMAALKATFGCHVAILTSPMGKAIASRMPCIDEVIEWEAPWVKGTNEVYMEAFTDIILSIRERNFDAAVIFTVFSQNPLPSALIATLAGIPNRLAYCRENPYHLLSHWVPDPEPYNLLRHQVRRDLALVETVGAKAAEEKIVLSMPRGEDALRDKLTRVGVDPQRPWIVLHPGVSEKKREYDPDRWIETGKRIIERYEHQIIVTGGDREIELAQYISGRIGEGAFSVAGALSLDELITVIRFAPLLISVNTGTIHLASALQTKVIVLYALTNPQHAPWKAVGKIIPFSVDYALLSNNEVLRFIHEKYYRHKRYTVTPDDILDAVEELLGQGHEPPIEELVLPPQAIVQGIRNTLNFQEP